MDELKNAGLQVVTVGMGEPKHAERYCGKIAPNVQCLADESHEAYYTYGLAPGGLKELASLSVLKAGRRAYKTGARQGETIGNAKMLPGTFIVDRAGKLQYTYYSAHAGDHPNIADLIKVATGVSTP